ncbi:helix-turn-helix domain-containing protein [Streptomyces sp. NBC_00510]
MEYERSAGFATATPSPDSTITYRAGMRLTAEQAESSERHFLHREHNPFGENGPFSHLTRLAVPHSAASRGFRFGAHGQLIDGLLSAQVYVDSLTGVSGKNLPQDPIVADVVASGWIEFLAGKKTYHVKPGQICIRDTKASWRFSCSSATNVHVISIPRHLVLPHIGSGKQLGQAYVADTAAPEVRFLLNYLEAVRSSSRELETSVTARRMARDACAALFSGIFSERPGPALDDHPRAIVAAARNVIERHLESGDLSPAMVAGHVGVSLRTLHRSFSAADDSVMACVRRRRLQKAHDELMDPDATAGIAEIAARWRFSDTSHFIRNFKSGYGATPAAYVRDRRAVGGGPDQGHDIL